ncbi:MAG: BolA family protein [Pseudomonadota bacterium]
MGQVADRIETKLRDAFTPVFLQVNDKSHLHAGHAGAPEGGESHFDVIIVSDAFTQKSRIDRQRMVNATLADELAGPVHALSVKVMTEDEARADEVLS